MAKQDLWEWDPGKFPTTGSARLSDKNPTTKVGSSRETSALKHEKSEVIKHSESCLHQKTLGAQSLLGTKGLPWDFWPE